MKKFADLSKAQKTFVVRFMEVYPEMRSKNVTYKDLLHGFELLKVQRDATGEKLGFPLWLQKTNIVGRGTYQFPYATAAELSAFTVAKSAPKVAKAKVAKAPKVKAPKVATPADPTRLQRIVDESIAHDEDVEDFNSILRENGITVE
jgi:hypothetical protein